MRNADKQFERLKITIKDNADKQFEGNLNIQKLEFFQ